MSLRRDFARGFLRTFEPLRTQQLECEQFTLEIANQTDSHQSGFEF